LKAVLAETEQIADITLINVNSEHGRALLKVGGKTQEVSVSATFGPLKGESQQLGPIDRR
jgi:hypothetical protein